MSVHRWKVAAGLATVACLCVVGCEVVPLSISAVDRYGAWRRQEARLRDVGDWDAERDRLTDREHQLKRRLQTLYVRLPSSDHMSAMLSVLQNGAERQHIDLREVRPGDVVVYPQIGEIPFEVEVRGSFHEIGSFLSYVERSPHVVRTRRVHIRRIGDDGAGLSAEFTLHAVILHDTEHSDDTSETTNE